MQEVAESETQENMSRQMVLMGVSGSGKSTIGKLLALALDWPFFDADDFHPEANVTKMASGHALTDEDRAPWLLALRNHLRLQIESGSSSILACSALKFSYRHQLSFEEVSFVYLRGSLELISDRLNLRSGHYMPLSLLESQFIALEEPMPNEEITQIDIDKEPAAIVAEIVAQLKIK